MNFTSLTFPLFLALVFSLHWIVGAKRWQNATLVVASFVFYAWWDYRFCALMMFSAVVDYSVGRGLNASNNPKARRGLLLASMVANLGMLGTFKYFNFFTENLVYVAGQLGIQMAPFTINVVLPIGISFYTFQTMSYTIDIYRRHSKASNRFLDYLTYVTFFPQLVAGPIERADHLLPQFGTARRFDAEVATEGCRQMLWGFFKKMVIADHFSLVVDAAYASPDTTTGPQLAFATFCFAFQIYCDFSAYSDIAIGTAKLFGIRLRRNFAYPYFSQSVVEFWRRWHISLSTWFRDYVYLSMGGSRCGRARRIFNVMVVFLVSGLWHGASWNFVIWGAVNGLVVIPSVLRDHRGARGLDETVGGDRIVPGIITSFRIARTFVFTNLAWVFFRAQDLDDSMLILRKIVASIANPSVYGEWLSSMRSETDTLIILVHLVALVALEWLGRRRRFPLHKLHTLGWPVALRWGAYTLLILDTLYYGTRMTGEFIYFQF